MHEFQYFQGSFQAAFMLLVTSELSKLHLFWAGDKTEGKMWTIYILFFSKDLISQKIR